MREIPETTAVTVRHGGVLEERPFPDPFRPVSDVQASLEEYRDVREALERAVLPLATSVDGRRFRFQTTLHELELEAGGYVTLGQRRSTRLGQVLSLELDSHDATGPGLPQVRIRIGLGEGVVLDGGERPFHDAAVRPATPDEVDEWLGRVRPARAVLEVGELALAHGVHVGLDGAGSGATHSCAASRAPARRIRSACSWSDS